jgi:dTDP-4-dehydrorhamnose reductase
MGFERAAVDVADPEAVEQCIAQNHPSWVVNAAAYNKVDAAEREPQIAFLANALAVRNLAVACRETNARLVHFSTDYIFDGLAGRSYTEDDEPHPLGAYAVSKLAGELYARAYLEEPLIIRTCGVYGPHGAATAQGNFVETMLRRAAQGQPVRVVDDYIASPTFAPALATRTVEMVERGLHGIFHAGGGTPISWYDWAAKIFQVAGLTPDLRRTNEQEFRTAARRPKYSALSNARMESLGVTPMPSLDEAIRAYFEARGTYASQVAR